MLLLKALKPQGPEEELSKYLPSLADEFFGLIITIFSARYTVGVGQVCCESSKPYE